MPDITKKNKSNADNPKSAALSKAKKRIYRQAALAFLTIILTMVILFAMTSAWYTNVVQTSGLVFQAEAWGFNGEIIVNEEPIVAGPGDDGLIHLEVENNGDSLSEISVNISKTAMEEAMQQRLYFYVDTQLTRNGETMDRVYLNNQESYTYTIFDQGRLTLTEKHHNDAQLKWQWVYDVLGYYVLGKWEEWETPDAETGQTGRMTVIEYLRPIEYSYDDATTTFETDENDNLSVELKTVDGKTTVEQFLRNISAKDGYSGVIDPSKKLENDFYPVDVDDEGYGVYAYMCNYAQIELATQYDTELGEKALSAQKGAIAVDAVTYEAKLTISAQKGENSVVNVGTLTAMKNAMEQGTADVIRLSSNVTIPQGDQLLISGGKRIMLDLNGYTIHAATPDAAIKALPGSGLTMTNGTIQGANVAKSSGIYATGAEVVLKDISIEGFEDGIYVGDSDLSNPLDSRVYMLDCTIDTDSSAIYVSGNGICSEQKTQVVVERSKLSSDGVVIWGNGTVTGNGRWGTDIQVIDSELISNPNVLGAGIYHPQINSTLTIYNSKVSGYTGVAVKGGSVSIVDSQIRGTGAQQEPKANQSGFSDTGDAVYIETNYEYDILLEISGNSVLTSDHSKSLQIFKPDALNVEVIIYSGKFKEAQPEAYIAEGSVQEGTTVKLQ